MTVVERANLSRILVLLALAVCLLVAGGGPFQVFFSGLYYCGRVGAGWSIYVLFAIAAAQIVLFLFAQIRPPLKRAYEISQVFAAILVGSQFALLAFAYPNTAVFFAICFVLALAGAFFIQVNSPECRSRGLFSILTAKRFYTAALAGILLLQFLVFTALIAQVFLLRPGLVLSDGLLAVSACVALPLAIAGGVHIHRKMSVDARNISLSSFAPLFVLLLAVLRAKYPDAAFDSFSYKATSPYLLAEWRTSSMAYIDPFLLGTNFQEIFNAVLVIVAGDYNPSLISTGAFAVLFLILPVAIHRPDGASAFQRIGLAFATVVIVTLTEAGTAQGTSYQEPFMVLMMAAALMNGFVWPIFLAAGISTKFTVITSVPLFLVYRGIVNQRDPGITFSAQLARAAGASALLVFLIYPQIDRNLTYTGRVLGLSETLASVTDPPQRNPILAPGAAAADGIPRGGISNNVAYSICNAVGLDLFCPVTHEGHVIFGFHVLPSSRAAIIAFFLSIICIVGGFVVRRPGRVVFWASGAFLLGYLVFLSSFSQGRYFVVPGFELALLSICLAYGVSPDTIRALFRSRSMRGFAFVVLAAIPVGDLMAGTYINDGWECRRDLLHPAKRYSFDRPRTKDERFLFKLAKAYKKACPPPGLPPGILLQPGIVSAPDNKRMLTPYLGANRLMEWRTQPLNERFFSVSPGRDRNLPRALLAIVVKDDAWLTQATRQLGDSFQLCSARSSGLKVYCSTALKPRGSSCARSIFESIGLPVPN
ncbi:MAG: hypothetical protein GY788_32730 [bacterium]|nr:hypothetical protein [bacterium]